MGPFFFLFVGFVFAVVLFLVLGGNRIVVVPPPPPPPPPESGCLLVATGLMMTAIAFVGFLIFLEMWG